MMATIFEKLEKLTGILRTQDRDRALEFAGIVDRLANDEDVKPTDVKRVLSESGKTLEDLTAAVQVKAERKQRFAKLEQVPRLERELADLNRKLEVAEKQFAKVRSLHEAEIEPINHRVAQISFDLNAARDEWLILFRTCNDPERLRRYEEASRELGDARDRLFKLKEAVKGDEEAKSCDQQAKIEGNTERSARWKDRAQKFRDMAAEARRLLPEAERRFSELEKLEKQAENDRVKP